MRRGTFEMATPDGYKAETAYLHGSFAVHRLDARTWKISHAATGYSMPFAYAATLVEAAHICDALERAADWSKIKRGRIITQVRGKTKAHSVAYRDALKELDLLPSWAVEAE